MREQGSKKGIFTNYGKKILAIIVMITVVGGLMPNTMLIADAAPKKARALKLNETNLEMYVGQKQTLKIAKVTPAKASKDVTWKTSNKKVVTVNSKGKITAKKAGSAKITAVSKSNSKVKVTCKIKVYNKPKSLKLNKTKYTLEVGDSFKLKVKSATPKNAYKKVKFSSTNSGVAKVESDGTVYGVSDGTATIKAKSVWNSKVTASCVVTVEEEKKVTAVPTVTPSVVPTKTPKPTNEPEPTLKTERVLLSGTYKNTSWTIDENGLLEISGTGEMYKYIEQENWMFVGYTMQTPWGEYKDIIKSAKVNVTDVQYLKKMFYGCENLEYVDLSGLQTDNVVDMSYMFASCKKLKEITWGEFNTENVIDMESMFSGCNSLETIDVSKFNTKKVNDMGGMFINCNSLKNIDLSNFDTENVTSMGSMFMGCNSLKNLDLSNFDTKNVTSMGSMFSGCDSLEILDLSNFNTENVSDMSYMFSSCKNVEKISLYSFDTKNVTDMSYMFSGCDTLESIDLSNFNTQNVTGMGCMFAYCDNLKTINLSDINMQNVKSIRGMFEDCIALEELDMSDFVAENLENYATMLKGCKNLKKIITPQNALQVEISLPNGLWEDDNGNYYTSISEKCGENAILKPLIQAEPEAIEGDIVKSGAYGQITWTLDTNGKLVVKGIGNVCAEDEYPGWLNVETNSYSGLKYVDADYDIKEAEINIKYATDLSNLFMCCKNLEKIDLTKVDMSTIENTNSMFYECINLKSIAFEQNVTSNLKNVGSMFSGCEKLETIDMSGIECQIENFYYFCDNCTSLKEINLENMNFSKIDASIGKNCSSLEKIVTPMTTGEEVIFINMGTWKDEEGNEYDSIPNNLEKSIILTRSRNHSGIYENTTWSIDDNGVLTVTGTGNMYQPYQEYDEDDYDDEDAYYTDMEKNYPAWIKYKDDIVSAVIDVQGATNAYGLFDGCEFLNYVDLSKFDMSQITNASYMFYGCSNLKNVEQQDWKFSKLVNAQRMFEGCGIEKIDFSAINIDTLENISYMFYNCDNLKWIDLSGLTLGNLEEKSFYDVISDCSNLNYIKTPNIIGNIEIELNTDEGKWKDDNGVVYKYLPTNIQGSIELIKEINASDMITPTPIVTTTPEPTITPIPTNENIIYSGSYKQTSWTIDKEGVLEVTGEGDTYREINHTNYVFYSEDEYGYTLRPQWTWYSDFIQAAKFNVKNTNAGEAYCYSRLFYNCTKLKYLDLSEFEANKYYLTLRDLKALETIITPNNIGYAEVKLPMGVWLDSDGKRYYCLPETTKTLKLQAKVIETGKYNSTEWFIDKSGLFELTGEGKYYSGLESGAVPNWSGDETVVRAVVNLKEVVDASQMFWDLCNLKEIDVTNLNLKKAETMAYMFGRCENIEELDLSMLDTANVEDMSNLFYKCSSLKQVDLSSFDTGNVKDMEDMFYGCDELRVIKTPCDSGEVTTELPEGIWKDEEGNIYTELPVNAEKSIVLTKVGEIEVDEGEIDTKNEVTLSTPVVSK